MADLAAVLYTSLKDLTPFNNNWIIKVKVIRKWNLFEINKGPRPGKVFNMVLIDEDGIQIAASIFDEAAVKYFPMIQPTGVYEMEGGQIKLQNKKYQKGLGETQIVFYSRARIVQLPSTDFSPRSRGFVKLCRLPEMVSEDDVFLSVMAIIKSVGSLVDISTMKGQYKKRSLELVDETGFSVQLCLWGEHATNPFFDLPHSKSPVIVGIWLKLTNYAQVTLATESNFSCLKLNPMYCAETAELEVWRDHTYTESFWFLPLTFSVPVAKPQPNFQSLKRAVVGIETTNSSFTTRVRIKAILCDESNSLWYNACPNKERCFKPMTEVTGQFYCQDCNQTFDSALLKYNSQFHLADSLHHIWAIAYDEVAGKLFGMTAFQLKKLYDSDKDAFGAHLEELRNSEVYLRVQVRVRNGCKKFTIAEILPEQWDREGDMMMNDLPQVD